MLTSVNILSILNFFEVKSCLNISLPKSGIENANVASQFSSAFAMSAGCKILQ